MCSIRAKCNLIKSFCVLYIAASIASARDLLETEAKSDDMMKLVDDATYRCQ